MKAKPINIISDKIESTPSVVAIGFFDGVHIGHMELITQMLGYAKRFKLESIIFTFDKSPKQVLDQDFDGYLTTPQEKFDLLSEIGADKICFVPFTREFASLSKESFVKDILIDKLNAKSVFVGFNFCFGFNKSGNSEILKKELAQYGSECHIIEPVKDDSNNIVSSSSIRQIIRNNDIPLANTLLGRKLSFSGKVVHGDHRATEMGFPTANLLLENSFKCLPPNGVYACYVDTSNGTYPAIVNIGYRPTFNKNTHLLEAHLCNFNGDLYGKEIRVRFLKAMRPEIKFPSMGALIAQIEKDRQAFLSSLPQ